MKRITTLLVSALCAIFLVSCEKDQNNSQWHRFYGFTKDDIVGHYKANPDPSAYQELPTEGVKVYDNATVDVTSIGENHVSICLNIPKVLINKTFSGAVYTADDNSDLAMKNGNEDIRMTIYKSNSGQVRLKGWQKRYYYDANQVLINSDNYGFDVVIVKE